MQKINITIPIEDSWIYGDLSLVTLSKKIVIFAHGSGSNRFSSRNMLVADFFNHHSISTLLFDLLTPQEDSIDQKTREFRFDIPMLAQRLILVTHWLQSHNETSALKIGYFGASTGAAAALIAAAQLPESVKTVVSRGGRPDLANHYLPQIKAPTLLIVGEIDYDVIKLNKEAFDQLQCHKELKIIPHASHLFEEPGTLEQAAQVSLDWFKTYLN